MSKPKLTETDIRQQVRDYLRLKGWLVIYHRQALGSYPGLPDIQAVKDGRTVYIELKTARGRQSEHQRRFEADLTAAGGEYLLCRGVDDLIERGI